MDKIKYLRELLGEKEDIHYEYYLKTKDLFLQGIEFPVKLHLDNDKKENILLSTFALHANLIQLISSDRFNKIIDDYPGKALIWETDILEVVGTYKDKIFFSQELSFSDLDETVKNRIIQSPQLSHFEGQDCKIKITLKTPGSERKYNEAFAFSVDHRVQAELRKIKEKFIFSHKKSLRPSEEDKGLALRLIHRLKLWGYDFSEANYLSEDFNDIISSQLHFHPLNFSETFALTQLHLLLMESYDNDKLLKEIEVRVQREKEKLQSNYNFLNKFKSPQ